MSVVTRSVRSMSSPPRRRPRLAALGGVGLCAALACLILVAAAIVGPLLWAVDPNQTNLIEKFAGASRAHPLGTDEFGRDLLARLLHGARLSIAGALLVVVGSTAVGLSVGVLCGALGGKVDLLLGRLVDALLSLPSLIVALGIVGVLGKSFINLLLALMLTGWPWYARLYRGFVLKERQELYVLAATALGCDRPRIAWRHIGPNIIGAALVLSTVNLGSAVLALASLSFLGLGVQPPTAEWGAMVNDARIYFQTHPWLIVAPGLAISVTVLAVNLLGDALRDATDPRQRRQRHLPS